MKAAWLEAEMKPQMSAHPLSELLKLTEVVALWWPGVALENEHYCG